MALDAELYLHDTDRTALAALKAIPGFEQVTKAFMKVWNEQQFKLINMSTNLKLGEKQLGKYYRMLPPICEKLGIEVPELYLELNVVPNAYTYGDTKPFIVLTSGLFDALPDELIPTVLAHECGHIACHHPLYTTMGRMLLSGTAAFVSGLGNIALYPIQLAFAYWMRCSEFSADRAAVICDGSAEKIIQVCMRFAGYSKNIADQVDPELFMEQAKEYREMVQSSVWNKTLEFLLFQNNSHPLNAVRAYESREWEKSERFAEVGEYLKNPEAFLLKHASQAGGASDGQPGFGGQGGFGIGEDSDNQTGKENRNESELQVGFINLYGEIVVPEDSRYYLGRDYREVAAVFRRMGFENVTAVETVIPKFDWRGKPGRVAKVEINWQPFEKNDSFPKKAEVAVYYYISI